MDRNQEQVPAGISLFFWNRNGLESIFYLPEQEQEFLNLRLILFMTGFLQLIGQFSNDLFTFLQLYGTLECNVFFTSEGITCQSGVDCRYFDIALCNQFFSQEFWNSAGATAPEPPPHLSGGGASSSTPLPPVPTFM